MEITERLIRRIARQEFGQMAKSGAYTRGSGGGSTYTLPVAADGTLGGIQIGYPTSATNRYYAVQLDDQQRAYVNVEWTDHHSWNDLTDFPSAAGGSTTPVYWNGSGFSQCTSYANASVNYATSAGNADTVDGYHESAFLHLTGGTMTGNIYIGNTTIYASGSNGGINSLAVADDCILGDCNIGGHLGLKSLNTNDAGISFYTMSGGGLGRVYTNGNFYFYNGSGGYASLYAQNGYAEGTWASKSDARMKNVVGDVDLTVEQIAAMPAVKFTWKNDPEKRVHVGTLAQPWQKVLPEAIETTQADTLMMCYGEAAMVSVIKLAQRVLELERMIKEK